MNYVQMNSFLCTNEKFPNMYKILKKFLNNVQKKMKSF